MAMMKQFAEELESGAAIVNQADEDKASPTAAPAPRTMSPEEAAAIEKRIDALSARLATLHTGTMTAQVEALIQVHRETNLTSVPAPPKQEGQ